MKPSRAPPPDDGAEVQPVIDMEREPLWVGGRFRVKRRREAPGRGLPLWARLGVRLKWPAGVVLAIAAVVSAALACALIAAAVFLPAQAR